MSQVFPSLVPKIGSAKAHRVAAHRDHGRAVLPASAGAPIPVVLRDDGVVQARTRQVEACVATIFDVRHEALRASTRGKAGVARARQVAMYVCHTTLGFSLTLIGDLFERDRTTVGHACRLVEDLRDNGEFDATMVCLERAVLCGCVSLPQGQQTARQTECQTGRKTGAPNGVHVGSVAAALAYRYV